MKEEELIKRVVELDCLIFHVEDEDDVTKYIHERNNIVRKYDIRACLNCKKYIVNKDFCNDYCKKKYSKRMLMSRGSMY